MMLKDKPISAIFDLNLDNRSVLETATIAEAVKAMQKFKNNCLLVIDSEKRGIGVISEHDIVVAFADMGEKAKEAPVADFMTLDLIVALEHETLDDIIKIMAKNDIRHIPIVSDSGYVRGFLSIMELITQKMLGG